MLIFSLNLLSHLRANKITTLRIKISHFNQTKKAKGYASQNIFSATLYFQSLLINLRLEISCTLKSTKQADNRIFFEKYDCFEKMSIKNN